MVLIWSLGHEHLTVGVCPSAVWHREINICCAEVVVLLLWHGRLVPKKVRWISSISPYCISCRLNFFGNRYYNILELDFSPLSYPCWEMILCLPLLSWPKLYDLMLAPSCSGPMLCNCQQWISCHHLARRMLSDIVSIFASTSSDGTVVIWEMVAEVTTSGKMIY
jgi:hypothetical protein